VCFPCEPSRAQLSVFDDDPTTAHPVLGLLVPAQHRGLGDLEDVAALDDEEDALARGEERRRGPDLDVELDDFAGGERQIAAVEVDGLVLGRGCGVELPTGGAEPA
jgi:hypothetical protein